MKKRRQNKKINCLTIAGFDPCGGAGILSDMKVFHRLGAYGLSVITAVTIQNTQGVFGIHCIKGDVVYRQLSHLSEDIKIDAVKIGMLCSRDVVEAVSGFLQEYKAKIVVMDTPIISSSAMPLISNDALDIMQKRLIPKTTVLTPNIPEAEMLTGKSIKTLQDIKDCAMYLHDLGVVNIVIKGGHYRDSKDKTLDLVFDGSRFEIIRGKLYQGQFHGTGCVYSSALTVCLCHGMSIFESARKARRFVVSAIKSSLNVGLGMSVLGI